MTTDPIAQAGAHLDLIDPRSSRLAYSPTLSVEAGMARPAPTLGDCRLAYQDPGYLAWCLGAHDVRRASAYLDSPKQDPDEYEAHKLGLYLRALLLTQEPARLAAWLAPHVEVIQGGPRELPDLPPQPLAQICGRSDGRPSYSSFDTRRFDDAGELLASTGRPFQVAAAHPEHLARARQGYLLYAAQWAPLATLTRADFAAWALGELDLILTNASALDYSLRCMSANGVSERCSWTSYSQHVQEARQRLAAGELFWFGAEVPLIPTRIEQRDSWRNRPLPQLLAALKGYDTAGAQRVSRWQLWTLKDALASCWPQNLCGYDSWKAEARARLIQVALRRAIEEMT